MPVRGLDRGDLGVVGRQVRLEGGAVGPELLDGARAQRGQLLGHGVRHGPDRRLVVPEVGVVAVLASGHRARVDDRRSVAQRVQGLVGPRVVAQPVHDDELGVAERGQVGRRRLVVVGVARGAGDDRRHVTAGPGQPADQVAPLVDRHDDRDPPARAVADRVGVRVRTAGRARAQDQHADDPGDRGRDPRRPPAVVVLRPRSTNENDSHSTVRRPPSSSTPAPLPAPRGSRGIPWSESVPDAARPADGRAGLAGRAGAPPVRWVRPRRRRAGSRRAARRWRGHR